MHTSGPIFFHRRYEPGAELGRGAQGVVVRVIDRENPIMPLVAKVWQGRSFHASSLHGEFALLSRLRIHGLVRAHDLARCEKTGTPFLIETFVDGPDARHWLTTVPDQNKGARVLLVLTAIASTLACLHDSGFLHGDLKPEHVRIAHSGQTPLPTLLDLGAAVSNARVLAAPIAFTPAFAAPEVRAGAAPTVAADLYGLGAMILAMVTGDAPGKRLRRRLFDEASWLPPTVATLVDELLAEHPRERPQCARDVLHRLGSARIAPTVPPLPIGRDEELALLRHAKPTAVRWIMGPSGSGKTHLVREFHTQMLLQGRDVRRLQFPADGNIVGKLVAYLHGNVASLPFTFARGGSSMPIVILDDVHHAPDELTAALDVFRCRHAANHPPVEFVVTARQAPPRVEVSKLESLKDPAFVELCNRFGILDPVTIRDLATATGKNPGWLVASVGSLPLERDTIIERARTLSAAARDLLAVFAISGGEIPESVCRCIIVLETPDQNPLAELSAAGIVTRRLTPSGLWHSLFSPNLAADLARTLETPERWQLTRTAWLEEKHIPTTVLLTLGTATSASIARVPLLERAAAQAHAEGVRGLEIDALLALVSIEAERTGERLLLLERLLRDGNRTAEHPRILEWLNAAAQRDATLLPLVLRRNAEKLAREGKNAAADEIAEQARRAAAEVHDPVGAGLAVATRGVVALYRADWAEAETCLGEARRALENVAGVDVEEMARIDHNAGVVALYRGRIADAIEAFERALETKRRLGDRAGIRSCLLNLGLAFGKAQRYDDAERVLQESLELARSLGQTAGQGWCLVARADVCIRRRDAAKAREWLAEAGQLEASLPQPIRADLAILQAEAALLVGDGQTAAAMLERIDPALRTTDALVDTRVIVLESRCCLARLPIAKHHAARLAVQAIRRARAAKLGEMENEALVALRTARMHRRSQVRPMSITSPTELDVWPWLSTISSGLGFDDAATSLARLVLQSSGAERVFLALVDGTGTIRAAVGIDLDLLPIALPMRRIDPHVVAEALGTPNPIVQRHIETSGHMGCRLTIAESQSKPDGSRALVVLEHRFSSTAFDQLSATSTQRWAILAGLLWMTRTNAEIRNSTVEANSSSLVTTNSPVSTSTPSVQTGQTTFFSRIAQRRQISTIIGQSAALERALARLDAAIDSDLPTLIVGETGTGKELFARALHDFGRRRDEPFVAVNCGAIPDALFEAELFGHIRGSFTGAERARAGLLSRAAKGTLFLDEIGELPLLRQATLLRVLQDRTYRSIGSDEEISFDVRIVAATNRDLDRAVETGTFRRDLLYRLNTLEIHVPPLRERRADIAELARLFLARAGARASLSPDALAALEDYSWPGNVRELEHVMQRLALQTVELLDRTFLPREIRAAVPTSSRRGRTSKSASNIPEDAARLEVEDALRRCQGNISRAAVLLGLTRHGLKKRMVRLGLRPPSGGRKKEA